MGELIEELKNTEINQDSDLDFYYGVVYALWKIGRFSSKQKMQIEDELKLKSMSIKNKKGGF